MTTSINAIASPSRPAPMPGVADMARAVRFVKDKACRLIAKMDMESSVLGTAVAAGGVVYVKTRCRLYALAVMKKEQPR